MIGHTFKQTEITTSDYQLRWWRLPIEENAYRKTLLGGGDYQLMCLSQQRRLIF